MDRSSRVSAVATPPRIAAGEVIPCWRCGQPITTDYWQRGYQAGGVLAGRTQALIAEGQRLLRVSTVIIAILLAATVAFIAIGWPWSAAITGVLCLVYGYLRWAVARRVKRLRTHLKEDQ